MKGRVVIAGGSGFIGRHLSDRLVADGYDIVILSRSAKTKKGAVRTVQWDGETQGPWTTELDGAHALINLAGRSINCRHSIKNRLAIRSSRISSVQLLGEACLKATIPPSVWIQASAVGIYGDAGDQICTEASPHGTDYIAQVCDEWEEAFHSAPALQTRKVVLRLGVVMGRDGGFLPVMTRLARLFLGGAAGSGEQFVSWIHIDDVCQMFLAAAEHPEIAGIYNATSPEPVTNRAFMSELRSVLHRPWSPPVPEVAVRAGSWLVGTEGDLALVSQRAVPQHFQEQDFPFQFPEVRAALTDLLRT